MTRKQVRKLKPGDFVVAKSDCWPTFTKDKIYTVKSIEDYSNELIIIFIEVDDTNSNYRGWHYTNFNVAYPAIFNDKLEKL